MGTAEVAVIVVFLAFCVVLVVFVIQRTGTPTLTIYSSLPHRELGGARDKQGADMERAIRLALDEAGHKAGGFELRYVALDASDDAGEADPERVRGNARRAAADSDTAVYIGDLTSGSSIQSIPILSKARVPQISPASTRVGLTGSDPSGGDEDEPDVHYPNGYRNFLRVIPNDNVQAAAIVALMLRDGCTHLATIYDGGDYSTGLTADQSIFTRPLRVFRQQVRPKAAVAIYERLARAARARGADCFQYAGSSNPNTLRIFQTFAKALPSARLYATDGVRESTFTENAADGFAGSPCISLSRMVPPRDLTTYSDYLRRFMTAYPDIRIPDPYAIYAYEATKLAIAAIDRAHGTRDKILDALRSTQDRPSVLGTYSINGQGDTTLHDYDVSQIHDCTADPPRRAVERERLERALRILQRRAESP